MVRMSANQDTPVSKGEGPGSPNQYIRNYMCSRSEIFRELMRVQVEASLGFNSSLVGGRRNELQNVSNKASLLPNQQHIEQTD